MKDSHGITATPLLCNTPAHIQQVRQHYLYKHIINPNKFLPPLQGDYLLAYKGDNAGEGHRRVYI